jgi:hypothetical protein
MIIIEEIRGVILCIEQNAALFEETNFVDRAEAIDFINFHIIDRFGGLLDGFESTELLKALTGKAENIKAGLEEVDARLFVGLRESISTGSLSGRGFRDMIGNYFPHGFGDDGTAIGYDNLDMFINGLLYDKDIPEPILSLEPEMVFYQKTPARIVFELVEQAQFGEGDVFFDIGSGLGQVVMLVNLMSGVNAKGIEFEPAYFAYAMACADQLNLPAVEFINADARGVDYSAGTVFFMYTPFSGFMLAEMLLVLRRVSSKITLFTYGPCSAVVAGESWLRCVNGVADDIYGLCRFEN